jgi:PAS domain S-box-containing protein
MPVSCLIEPLEGIWVQPHDSVCTVAKRLQQLKQPWALVGSPAQVLGIVTVQDLLGTILSFGSPSKITVAEAMSGSPPVLRLSECQDPETVLQRLEEETLPLLPVQNENGEVIGVVTQEYLQKVVIEQYRQAIHSTQTYPCGQDVQQQLQQKIEQEHFLNKVVQAIRQSLELEQVFTVAATEISSLLRAEVAIVEYSPEAQCWRHRVTKGMGFDLPQKQNLVISDVDNPFAAQLKQKQVVQVNNTSTITDPINRPFAEDHQGAWLLIPISVYGEVWGSLTLTRHHADHWTEMEINLGQRVADQLGVAIYQAQLYQQCLQELAARQQVELALKESQLQLQQILDSAQATIVGFQVFADGQWNYLYYSQGAEQIYGFSPDQFFADPYLWDSRVPEEDVRQASIRHRLEDIVAERPISTIYRFLHKDNSLRWIHCTMVPRRDDAQNCWFVTAVGVDITEQKLLEEELRRYERVVSATVDGISLVDPTYTYRLINNTYLRWNQKHRDQIVGHTVAELLGEETFTRLVKPNIDRCLQGEVVTYEDWFEFPGVKQKFVSVTYSPYRDLNGMISGIVASTHDLTSLKRTEQVLYETQMQYLTLVNTVQGIVWEADPATFQFTFVSAQAEKILGYPVSQWLEPGFWVDHIHPEDREAVIKFCQESTQALKSHSFEYRMISAKGEVVWLYDSVTVVDEAGVLSRLQGLMVDITERKLADASLKDYQQMIQQVAESTLAILYVYDLLENRNIFVNPQIEAVLGYSSAEIEEMGSSLFPSLVHPDDLFQVLTLKDRCSEATADEILPIEYRIRHKDGSYRWLLSRDRVIKRTANGDPWQILGVATDITHQKHLQVQLAEQVEREHLLNTVSQQIRQTLDLEQIWTAAVQEVRQLLNTERVIIYRLEQDGTGMIVSESVEPGILALLGIVIEDSCFTNHWHRSYQQGRISQINDIETAAIQPCHLELLRRCQVRANLVVPILQGEDLWGLLIAHHCSEPKEWQPWTVKLMQQIASQLGIAIQQAEIYTQLRQSESYNRALVDAIPDLLLQVKRDGTRTFIKYGSDYGDEVKLYHPEDMVLGTSILDTLPPHLAQQRLAAIEQALNTHQIQIYEQVLNFTDRQQFEEVRVIPYVADEVLIIVRDITERKLAEAQMEAARQEAETANAAKSQFLATMSHEIRTPLNAVLGMISLLEQNSLTVEQRQLVRTIRNGGEVLLAIISDLLDFSRIEAGRLELSSEPLEVRTTVESVLALFEAKLAEKQLQLSLQVDPQVPQWIQGDAQRLQQILINLLSNALKFTEQGSITVTLSATPHAAEAQTCEIHFQVQDTGVGIDPDKIDLIFQPFQQEDSSISRRYGGTGLGLSICRHLCEMMGGTISFQSYKGVGSTFSLTVPAEIVPPPQSPESPSVHRVTAVPSPSSLLALRLPLRILVVEDDPVNQTVAEALLCCLGYQPTQVSNGVEALAALEQQAYDVIFMDVEMPEMDGLTATRLIRHHFGHSVCIIGMSAAAFPESRQRALEVGMNDYLTKPIQLHTLSAALQQSTAPTSGILEGKPALTLDPQVLLTLKMVLGVQAVEVIPRMLQAFMRDTTQRLQDMAQALAQEDYVSLRKLAHGLKGTSSQLGAQKLYQLAQDLEAGCRIPLPSQHLQTVLQHIHAEFTHVSQALEQEIA